MTKKIALQLSPELELPLDAVTQTIAILAKRRRGKTYTASVLAEEFIKHELPFVAIDPTGAWWGLRSSADGKHPGYPVVVIGGRHGDLPLAAEHGAAVADLVTEHPGWYVLDVSSLSKGATDRFATDFAERLYDRKKDARFPLHVFVDEADAFVPQQPMPDQRRMLGAFDTLVRRGGIHGIGVTLISQRPAVVSKNVLSQCELLIALQIIGVADRTAIDDWVKGNGTKEQREAVMDSLATLDVGEAWIWSPSWMSVFKRIRVRERETFNSSATPGVREAHVEPKTLAAVDLAAFKQRFAAAIEESEANDPKVLHKKIAELEKKLAARALAEQIVAVVPKQAKMMSAELHELAATAASNIKSVTEQIHRIEAQANTLVEFIRAMPSDPPAASALQPLSGATAHERLAQLAHSSAARQIVKEQVESRLNRRDFGHEMLEVVSTGTPPRGERAVLEALAMRHPTPLPKKTLATLACYRPDGGGFNNILSALRTQGLIASVNGVFSLTHAGLERAGSITRLTSRQILARWESQLPPREQEILREIVKTGTRGITKEELANNVAMVATAGGFNNYISHLCAGGLVERRAGKLVASDVFIG